MEPVPRRAFLTRREVFSAAHRLYSAQLSEQQNHELFGKCCNPNGHGHNYTLELTVTGHVDRVTGMVMNIADLKSIVDRTVMQELDHRHLDLDVPHFRDNGIVSTTENVAIFIWGAVSQLLPNHVRLHEVKLWETDKNIVCYRGD